MDSERVDRASLGGAYRRRLRRPRSRHVVESGRQRILAHVDGRVRRHGDTSSERSAKKAWFRSGTG